MKRNLVIKTRICLNNTLRSMFLDHLRASEYAYNWSLNQLIENEGDKDFELVPQDLVAIKDEPNVPECLVNSETKEWNVPSRVREDSVIKAKRAISVFWKSRITKLANGKSTADLRKPKPNHALLRGEKRAQRPIRELSAGYVCPYMRDGHLVFEGIGKESIKIFEKLKFKSWLNKTKKDGEPKKIPQKRASVKYRYGGEYHWFEVTSVKITTTDSRKWYAHLTLSADIDVKFIEGDMRIVAIDVGSRAYITDSNGRRIFFPKAIRDDEKRLAKLNRARSRLEETIKGRIKRRVEGQNKKKEKGEKKVKLRARGLKRYYQKSKQWKEIVAKISNLYAKSVRQRDAFIRETVAWYAKNYDVVVMEDLNVAGMLKGINKVSTDEYKAMSKEAKEKYIKAKAAKKGMIKKLRLVSFRKIRDWMSDALNARGGLLILVPTFYPSSKECSRCHHKNYHLGSDLMYVCPNCDFRINRDINAAKNILSYAQEVGEFVDYSDCRLQIFRSLKLSDVSRSSLDEESGILSIECKVDDYEKWIMASAKKHCGKNKSLGAEFKDLCEAAALRDDLEMAAG